MANTFTNLLNLTLLELGLYARKSRMVIYHISKTEDKLKLLRKSLLKHLLVALNLSVGTTSKRDTSFNA